MIIWLASYPKSGNTWIRIFLNSMLFSNNKVDVDINSNSIDQFPLRSHFEGLTNNTNDINEFAKNCINAQDKINLDNKIKILKLTMLIGNKIQQTFHSPIKKTP